MINSDSITAMISFCLEMALIKRNYLQYQQVLEKLESEQSIKIFDCVTKPHQLRDVLLKTHGRDYWGVILDLEKELSELTTNVEVKEFLDILKGTEQS